MKVHEFLLRKIVYPSLPPPLPSPPPHQGSCTKNMGSYSAETEMCHDKDYTRITEFLTFKRS